MKIYLAKNRETLTGDELKKAIERLRKIHPITFAIDGERLDYLLQFANKITIYKIPTKQDILDKLFHKSERNDPEIKGEAQEIHEALKGSYSPLVIIEYKRNQKKPKYLPQLKDTVDSYFGDDDEETSMAISINYVDLNGQGNLSTIYVPEDYRFYSDVDEFGKRTMKEELLDVLQGNDEY